MVGGGHCWGLGHCGWLGGGAEQGCVVLGGGLAQNLGFLRAAMVRMCFIVLEVGLLMGRVVNIFFSRMYMSEAVLGSFFNCE